MVGLIEVMVLVLLLATVGGRLLGVRLPLRHALLTGLPGLAAGILFAYLAYRRHPGHITPQVVGSGVVAAVVTTMLGMVLVQLLARPARPDLGPGGLPHPLRALRRMAQSTRRYGQLTAIGARYGLPGLASSGRADPARLGRRLRLALEEAGPIFVKLGQVLSTRTDLLPVPVTTELARLQDRVPAAPWPQVQALLAGELALDPAEVFKSIDPEPLASASLAQAHAAWRTDGTAVILKIQRPGIDEQVTADLGLIRRLARRAETQSELARAYHAGDLAEGFADALAAELDFRVEARNVAEIAAAAPAGAAVVIPAVHTDLSTRRLLVLEQLDGVSVRDAGPRLDALGADRPALARELLGYLLRQILVQGTFHADPHPGNVLVLRSGQLALIDFGSVGRLDIGQQAALRQLLAAIGQRDPAGLYDAVTELAVTRPGNEDALEQILAAFMASHLGPGMTPDAALMRDLLSLLGRSGMVFPPVIAGVFRALLVLDGTLRTLAPGFDISAESQALAGQLAGPQLTPASLRDLAAGELLTLLPMLRKLPRRADRISAALAEGRFTASLRLFSDSRDVSVITTLVDRAVLGLVGAALGVMSVILLLATGSPRIASGLTVLQLLGYVGLFLAVTLILRVVSEILSPYQRR
jgi:ubiquinone biosynthesis protein